MKENIQDTGYRCIFFFRFSTTTLLSPTTFSVQLTYSHKWAFSVSVIIALRLITLRIDRHYQNKLLLHFIGFQGDLGTNPALSKTIGCLKKSDIDDQAPNIFNSKALGAGAQNRRSTLKKDARCDLKKIKMGKKICLGVNGCSLKDWCRVKESRKNSSSVPHCTGVKVPAHDCCEIRVALAVPLVVLN